MNALAIDYANYVKVNLSTELTSVDEALEDILTRLEEFKSLVEMVKHDDGYQMSEPMAHLSSCRSELDCLAARIDSLGLLVERARLDVDSVERDLNSAEAEMGSSDGKLRNMLKPLFFKKSEQVVAKPSKSPLYEPSEIFSTSEFFYPQEDLDKK
ncbi:biogenesis of lysosome-related organelles complex 1 subunit 4 isoform X1 [Bacillus rossius redtenbacheri]|uniref:biogenesis of lysosome-related organelles complex 1 subunit 4 isoform X1 n=1 Tax=Bacillus rossius redtenbacheri TaxID=93214 RepID=UPI002FDD9D4D